MVWHQAIGKDIAKWQQLLSHFFQEIKVVVPVEKYLLAVVSAVVDMI